MVIVSDNNSHSKCLPSVPFAYVIITIRNVGQLFEAIFDMSLFADHFFGPEVIVLQKAANFNCQQICYILKNSFVQLFRNRETHLSQTMVALVYFVGVLGGFFKLLTNSGKKA